jgi:tripartite-type tricarboxylate transporter receptor subunit TctC
MKKLIILLMLCVNSHAQNIEFVVSTAAGGPSDFVSRKIVDKLEQNSSLNFLVLNKPGASQKVGHAYIEQTKKPTLFISTSEILDSEIYNLVEPIYNLGEFKNLIMVKNNTVNSVEELSKKKEVKFGHSGEGTFSYRGMVETCKKMNCLPVPFKSGTDGMVNVFTGVTDAYSLVSFGSKQFTTNDNYKVIGEITLEKNWVKLFGKNLTPEQKETIKQILKNTDKSFLRELGLR